MGISYDNTKKITFVTEMAAGWKLYGKTGAGSQLDKNGNKMDLSHGWFIRYLEKGKRRVVFVNHIVYEMKQGAFVPLRAKSDTLIKLWYIINYELEK